LQSSQNIEAWYRKLGREIVEHSPSFRDHCRWFARRMIALESPEKIANSEDVTKTAVHGALKFWANTLQMELPVLPAGRTKK
jgi:hypothetical protein